MIAGIALYSCEGPMGPAGKDGENGTNGTDGTDGLNSDAACKLCHNPSTVDIISVQYQFSKHEYGEAAFEEAGSTSCGPCHLQEAFKYVCANNTTSSFVLDAATGKYSNGYSCSSSTAYGELGCSTCHSSIHNTGTAADISPLTTVAPVSMTMYGGAKTINLSQNSGESNLCVKCHQPRPFTKLNTDVPNGLNGNVLDYASFVSAPTNVFYDAARVTGYNVNKPGYRLHTHYGTAGAIYAGVGGVEFGTGYTNSWHTTSASCQDCHMATMSGRAGGHTFFAKGNFNGCNVTGCHIGNPISDKSTTYWLTPRAEIKGLLDALAAKLKVGGIEILNRNPDSESNLWVNNTTNKYDGYLNIYDPINNPNGLTNNTAGGGTFKATSTTGFSSDQITTNNGLTAITLTNAQMGAIINFQLCLRDYSLGIHNFDYTKTLLTNSIAALP